MKIKPIHQASYHCGAVQFELALPNGIENPRSVECSMCKGVNHPADS